MQPLQRTRQLFALNSLPESAVSVVDKFCETSAIADLRKFDLFAFSETWLNSTILNECILMSGFSPALRKDRNINRGGGVALREFCEVARSTTFFFVKQRLQKDVNSRF